MPLRQFLPLNIFYDGQPIYIDIGRADKNWYEEHQLLFEKIYGKDRLSLITSLFAATSINSSLQANVRLFRKALHEIENNLPFSSYLPVMLLQLERIRAGEPIKGRKITNFAAALSGNVNAVVVDIWLLRAYEMDRKYSRIKTKLDFISGTLYSRKIKARSSGATNAQYNYIEKEVRAKAKELDLEPRQVSAMIWSGVRTARTGNKQTKYKEVLLHQLYNMFDNPINQKINGKNTRRV